MHGHLPRPWRFTLGRRPDLMSPSPLESPLLAPPWPPILLFHLKELARAGLVSREDHLPHGCVQLPGQRAAWEEPPGSPRLRGQPQSVP